MYLYSGNSSGDPNRKFNLRRYFSFFSIGVIIVLTIVLSALVYWNQKETLVNYSISSARLFAQELNSHIHENFIHKDLIQGNDFQIEKYSPQYLQLDNAAKTYLIDYRDIKKIKIFNIERKIVYSTDPVDIGLMSDSETMQKAFNGKIALELTRREKAFAEDSSNKGKRYNMDILEVYVPIYRDSDKPSQAEIIGVFEIYQDVSPIFSLMRKEFYKIPLLLIFSMGMLYLLLQIIVKKADAIINKQNKEIDLNNEELIEAQKRIKTAIDEVIEHESFHVRLQCDNLLKCWEVKDCEHAGCPSYRSENLRCWQVSGTFCGGKAQGFFASKYGDCRKCEVYQNAFKDRISMIGESFNNMMVLLESKHLQLQKLNERLNVLIDTDPLTETGNRRSFQKRMESIHLVALRYDHPYSIIICDVDYFKLFNDTYGHQKGDFALISIVNVMKTSLRRTDEIFRWGGEEFIVILPEQNMQAALKVAENLRFAVESIGISHTGSPSKLLTVSAGVACNLAENVKYISWESVIKQADDELYKAKAAGKNCISPSTKINKPKSGN